MVKAQEFQDELVPLREKKILIVFIDAVINLLEKTFFNSVD